ncbi:hypothetical protein SAMN05443662_0026 [Sulfurivirga caldicuralii]|uniref:MEMO1 family protein SAMN05443662_0026 n=1 Tax=Sulfurivirga caldicuralii TaxID=364032 RepID=A0A1N6DCA1_9GAMM|nr:AmmeMemoRadiSam system protein B [Sulfurivirga caldicuralii]SIN68313.1 hypothetical protein SAMN05443662_0026 [Sulfurivirga caldicuralii]
MEGLRIRPPAVAGMFYPADAAELDVMLEQWLSERPPVPREDPPRALIVPHAGYVYSGEAAARAFSLWKGADQIETVVVVGPAHRVPFYGIATVSADALATPLGTVPVDTALRDELVQRFDFVGYLDEAHAPEHSLEVELPFIQKTVPQAKVVPLLNGQISAEEEGALFEYLWNKPGVYFVISSDLSHYHPYEEACLIDAQTAHLIESGRWDQLTGERACGFKGIQGLLQVAERHPLEMARLALVNSGDTAGPKDQVVGYGAWAIWDATTQ